MRTHNEDCLLCLVIERRVRTLVAEALATERAKELESAASRTVEQQADDAGDQGLVGAIVDRHVAAAIAAERARFAKALRDAALASTCADSVAQVLGVVISALEVP